MKVSPIFAWYDMWIGMFWDKKKRVLYILPIPCLGLKVSFKDKVAMSLSIYADSLPYCYFEEFCYGTICVSPGLCRKSKSELTEQEKFRINQVRRNAGHDPIDFTNKGQINES